MKDQEKEVKPRATVQGTQLWATSILREAFVEERTLGWVLTDRDHELEEDGLELTSCGTGGQRTQVWGKGGWKAASWVEQELDTGTRLGLDSHHLLAGTPLMEQWRHLSLGLLVF